VKTLIAWIAIATAQTSRSNYQENQPDRAQIIRKTSLTPIGVADPVAFLAHQAAFLAFSL
jgi:hypothetical protein